MEKFVIRTKRIPRNECNDTVIRQNKKQATIESLASVVIVEEILRLKCQLESEVSSSDDILAALTILSAKNLSKDVLLSTKVGHTVNRLRRHGDSEEIRNQAKKVFRRWITFVRDLEREKPIIDVHCDKKTEVLRGKARQLLADALQVTVSDKLPELIERTVFHQFCRLLNNSYKRKIRSLVFILKHRDSIRKQVITGEITIQRLVSSSTDQL